MFGNSNQVKEDTFFGCCSGISAECVPTKEHVGGLSPPSSQWASQPRPNILFPNPRHTHTHPSKKSFPPFCSPFLFLHTLPIPYHFRLSLTPPECTRNAHHRLSASKEHSETWMLPPATFDPNPQASRVETFNSQHSQTVQCGPRRPRR